MKSLRCPHFLQVALVSPRPLACQTLGSRGKITLNHFQGPDLEDAAELAIDDMEMRHTMLSGLHPNHDSIKPRNDGHGRRDCHQSDGLSSAERKS
jgi:hypothetical protein